MLGIYVDLQNNSSKFQTFIKLSSKEKKYVLSWCIFVFSFGFNIRIFFFNIYFIKNILKFSFSSCEYVFVNLCNYSFYTDGIRLDAIINYVYTTTSTKYPDLGVF